MSNCSIHSLTRCLGHIHIGESIKIHATRISYKRNQESFREHRHLHVCGLWPWVVTLTVSQGQKGLCHYMVLIVLYRPWYRYDVCEFNSLRDMTISLFLWPLTFACDLHSPSRSLSFLSLDWRYIVVYWFQVRSL